MEDVADRFWRKVKVGDPGECWIWMAYRDCHGYGRFRMGGGLWVSHRVAWTLARGDIPEGACVCHKCDVRACVNPSHLFLGSVAQNNADMVSKGRQVRGGGIGDSRLNRADVLAIRRMRAETGLTLREIGRRFGVAPGTVSHITRGRSWAWLGDPNAAPGQKIEEEQ